MPTKNLVPRADGEGKLGIKGDTDLNWKEMNAVTGSLELTQTNQIQNQSGNDLFIQGSGITITHAEDSTNGFQYTISSSSTGFTDKIEEGQAKVETIDTGTDARIEFWVDPNDDGTSDRVWQFNSDGHLIPENNATFDIGSAEKKVRHFYLSSNSLKFGGESLIDSPYHLGVDINTNKFQVSIDNGANFDTITLSSDLDNYATQAFVTSQGYVTQVDIDNAIQGLDVKDSVRVATTDVLTGFTYVNAGTQEWQENSATGALTIDDIVLVNGDRVLVKDALSPSQNGIYIVSGIDGSSQVVLDRASDLDNASNFSGAFTFVEEGTTNTGNSYVAKNTNSPNSTTVGTNAQNWTQFNSAGGGASALNDLSDVTITSSDAGDYLRYDGSAWVDTTLNIVDDTTPQLGGTLDLNNQAVQGNLIPSAVDTYSLGSSAAEWSDLYLGDNARINFGHDQDVYFSHDPDFGLTLSMSNIASTNYNPYFTISNENDDDNDFGATIRIQNRTTNAIFAGRTEFFAESSDGNLHFYSDIQAQILDNTLNSEKARLMFRVNNGANRLKGLQIDALSGDIVQTQIPAHDGVSSGLFLGDPTGSGGLVTAIHSELNLLDISAQNFTAGDDGKVLSYDHGTTSLVWAAASSGGINSVSEDTDPSLGGDLNVGTHSITTDTLNGNITITPNGTGHVDIDGIAIRNGLIHIYNDGINVPNAEPAPSELRLYCESSNSHYTGLKASPHTQYTGGSVMYTLPPTYGSANQVLKTSSSGTLAWTDALTNVSVASSSNAWENNLDHVLKYNTSTSQWESTEDNSFWALMEVGSASSGIGAPLAAYGMDTSQTNNRYLMKVMQLTSGERNRSQNFIGIQITSHSGSNDTRVKVLSRGYYLLPTTAATLDLTTSDYASEGYTNDGKTLYVKPDTGSGIPTYTVKFEDAITAADDLTGNQDLPINHVHRLGYYCGTQTIGGLSHHLIYVDAQSIRVDNLKYFDLSMIKNVSTTAPTGGQVLTWDDVNTQWAPADSAGGGGGSYPAFNNSGTALTVNTTLTANTTDIEEIVVCNPTSSGITITLPDGSLVTDGFKYQIKNIGTQTVTITPNSSQTIDTVNASITADQYNSYTLINYADNWLII